MCACSPAVAVTATACVVLGLIRSVNIWSMWLHAAFGLYLCLEMSEEMTNRIFRGKALSLEMYCNQSGKLIKYIHSSNVFKHR